ncbi:MAG TPA: PDZ domain-containing protein [Candidatus Polarisedimenticolia bacterium]|nr:PDZ domain-containing protein [Candidatus Polarisedimenticolia bacterium]
MMRKMRLLAPALLIAACTLAVAGTNDHYKCTKSTQDCLDSMVSDLRQSGWIGLELDKADEMSALVVKRVVPGSPAESAGFQVGDELVAMNGIKFGDENKEALKAARKALAPGKNVTYTVSRAGAEKKLTATLTTVPNEVLAQWIGNHMLEHTTTAVASNK